ncbi:MAG TPA: polymer-forming cytoskeletal protein [Candidatus Sabulitectum sp.]|nr:polymer-forming cytoskeletal protein [Candidatus Sabulitectum sp.]HPJ29033.1 polymer-forming cytoskeletal protein [Candidatus Sabulitectum sp.]HPR22825.1 polymer-forming cytoskeletal protein [Candidatus Sabulitectum sp.]HRW77883.1 polymer-forming cytoskeletal protein [Candidatus Sabulitectum sp.]
MAKDDGYSSINSTVGGGSTITGSLDVNGGLRIDGFVDGQVKVSGTLTVGHEGRIKGDVVVNHAVIGGTVNGTIKAEKQLELQNGSRIEGDIITKSLIIEEGVFFEGHCSMSSLEGKPKQK